MCKVIALTNASKLTDKQVEKICNELLSLEHDGVGYAIKGDKSVYGERSIDVKFTTLLRKQHKILNLPIVEIKTKSFGDVTNKPVGPGIFHGRTSTNKLGLINTHPMELDGWFLVHNGVVTDHGPKYKKTTDNDSEDVLYRLIEGIESVERHLSGYYAFAAIDPQGRLHIGKDSTAQLHIAYAAKLESYIIATTQDLVEFVAKTCGVKLSSLTESFKSNTYCIFQGNKLIHNQLINPRGYSDRESKYAESSLGHSLSVKPTWDNYNDYKNYHDSVLDVITRPDSTQDSIGNTAISELERLDDSYEFITPSGEHIDLHEFYKLDSYSQASCVIVRPDGTVVDDESYKNIA